MVIKSAPSFNSLRTATVDAHHFTQLAQGMAFLAAAEEEARAQGFEILVGPVGNSSWDPYRLVLYSDASAPFLGEPASGPYDLEAYLKSGFAVVDTHLSAKADLVKKRRHLKKPDGFTAVNWDCERAEELLTGVYGVILKAFANAPFFAPIPVEKFIARYLPLLKRVDPQFLWVGYNDAGKMVAFFLAYADTNWPKTLVMKTYAGLMPGAGCYLFGLAHKRAQELGYKQAVHCLIRESNSYAMAASRRLGLLKVFRRYAVMGKLL